VAGELLGPGADDLATDYPAHVLHAEQLGVCASDANVPRAKAMQDVTVERMRWTLRPTTADDRDFLFALHRAAMRPYVDATWGWDDDEQARMFDQNFDPAGQQIVQLDGVDAGMLAVEETDDEICLDVIEIHPRFQRRGLGTEVIRSVLARGAATGKPVTLRVLHTNPRARSLYERLGFQAFREIETHAYLRAD
jgi:ribosomal protein S18 acetylase RimI-like enzyme